MHIKQRIHGRRSIPIHRGGIQKNHRDMYIHTYIRKTLYINGYIEKIHPHGKHITLLEEHTDTYTRLLHIVSSYCGENRSQKNQPTTTKPVQPT